jgi:hypothetical protein
MNIAVRATPHVHLVVHLIEVQSASKSVREGGDPIAAVHAGCSRRAGLGVVIKQRGIGVVNVGGIPREVCRLGIARGCQRDAISGVGIVRIGVTLPPISCHREAPVSVSIAFWTLRHPRQHGYRHERPACSGLYVLHELHRVAVCAGAVGRRASESAKSEILEEIIAGCIVGAKLPVVC